MAGKEQTGTSDGRMGGYLEEQVKRGDSVFFYRSPSFADQYGQRSDSFYSSVSGGLTAEGGFDFSNVHFLGMNEAIGKNEILDETYSGDPKMQTARKLVRKAFYIKSALPASTNAVSRSLGFTCNSTAANSKISISPYLDSDDILLSDLGTDRITGNGNDCNINATALNKARYVIITIEAKRYAGSAAAKQDFVWARSYIIPGSTMYFASGAGTDDEVLITAGANISFSQVGEGGFTIAASSGTATISDGDYGDITVSNTGSVWSIDDNTVGPDELKDLPVMFGEKPLKYDLSKYEAHIFAEITDAAVLSIEKIEGKPGEKVSFDDVLLTSLSGKVNIGKPVIKNSTVVGVVTQLGIKIYSKSVILTSGTFLNGLIHVGEKQFGGGRAGEKASIGVTEDLVSLSLIHI